MNKMELQDSKFELKDDAMKSLYLDEALEVKLARFEEISLSQLSSCVAKTELMASCLETDVKREMSKTIDECLANTSKASGDIVQSITSLIGNTFVDIHEKIDNLYHKTAETNGKLERIEEIDKTWCCNSTSIDVTDLDRGRMGLKELEDKFNSHFQVKLDKIEDVSFSKIEARLSSCAADVEQKLLAKFKAANDAIRHAVTVQIDNAVDDFREEIFWLVAKKKGRKR